MFFANNYKFGNYMSFLFDISKIHELKSNKLLSVH